MTSPEVKHDHITHEQNGFTITYTVADQSRREMLTYRLRTNYGPVTDQISADDQQISIEAVPKSYAEEIANRFEYWQSATEPCSTVSEKPTIVEDELDQIERTNPSVVRVDNPEESPATEQLVYTNPTVTNERTVIVVTGIPDKQPRESAIDILVGCFEDTPFDVKIQDVQQTTYREHSVWVGAMQFSFSES